jgi:hypothetical protein
MVRENDGAKPLTPWPRREKAGKRKRLEPHNSLRGHTPNDWKTSYWIPSLKVSTTSV